MFFTIFKRLSVAKNRLRPEKVPLKFMSDIFLLFGFLSLKESIFEVFKFLNFRVLLFLKHLYIQHLIKLISKE